MPTSNVNLEERLANGLVDRVMGLKSTGNIAKVIYVKLKPLQDRERG